VSNGLTIEQWLERVEKKVDEVLEDHENRLRSLEGTRLMVKGGWWMLGLLASTLAGGTGLILGVYALVG